MNRIENTMRNWLRTRAADVAIDEDVLQHSRSARIGKKLIQASVLIHLMIPVLTVAGIILVLACPALAQAPGGSIFGGSDQTVGNAVREAVKWARNLLFFGGVFGVIWGIWNYMTEKSCTKQLIGAVGCFGFGGIAALAFSFSQGNAVNLNTDLN
jgi:hypothetical protein